MSTRHKDERSRMEKQCSSLQEQKKVLEVQVEKMETAFQQQLGEIKELERRFETEQHERGDALSKKDQQIAFLHHQIESISRKNTYKEVELKSEMESEIEQAVLRGKSETQSQVCK